MVEKPSPRVPRGPQLRHWLVIVAVVLSVIVAVFAWNSAAGACGPAEAVSRGAEAGVLVRGY